MNSNTCNLYDPGTNEPLSYVLNKFGQKIGLPLSDDLPTPPFPNLETVHGITCRLEPLKVHHAEDLLYEMAENDSDWTYLLTDRPKDLNEYRQLVENYNKFHDRVNVAIVDNKTNKAVGSVAYMRIDPTNCSLEIGAVNFSKAMQKTKMGTEAIYLMMKTTFGLGYRRLEWKCDALNERSRLAALRYGFTFEGIFRQTMVLRKASGTRNRDTAWFSIIGNEWPEIKRSMELWLSNENFDKNGNQIKRLHDLMKKK